MPPPPRRHGRPITSPRHLALRHGRRILHARLHGVQTNQLEKGWEQLFSADVPGLQAGSYVASAKQEIEASDNDKLKDPIVTNQPFRVLGPRFTLPADVVYSVYPPPGHVVPHEVLPHIVFNDATLPWERRVQTKPDGEPEDPLNTVPWLALLVFVPEELAVDAVDLTEAYKSTSIAASVKQNETMAIETPMNDIVALNSEKVVKLYDETNDSVSKTANVLMVKKDLFNAYFSRYDNLGQPAATTVPYISRFKYLTHLRRMNVEGMTFADDHPTDTDREFGVVVANRIGPIAEPKLAPVIVHLVSLEKVDGVGFPVTTPYVGMISLYSWRYTVQPPDFFDVKTTFERLASTSSMLRPPIPIGPLLSGTTQRVLDRLHDGYSLSRYQLQTGEETVALFRGPLVPTDPVQPTWELLSTSGSDLHILDKDLGMLDITFSSAWHLGRTLALADRAFATALVRVRREISKRGSHVAQAKVLQTADQPIRSRLELASEIEDTLGQLALLSEAEAVGTRWATMSQAVNLSRTSLGVSYFRRESLQEPAAFLASAEDGRPYNEFNTPNSVDWAVLHKFVMDLYHLHNVPSVYLFTDPSHVPPESLRFFVIDQAWIDACVDGALSLGNHSSRERDDERAAIKDELNKVLEQADPELGYKPPVPRLGFVVRSEVVSKFPDLQIGVENTMSKNQNPAPKLVRTMQLAEGMLMGFLSEAATGSADEILTFTVPAHQQYFTVAKEVTLSGIDMLYKRVYSTDSSDGAGSRGKTIAEPFWNLGVPHVDGRPTPFNWESRLLIPENLAQDVYKDLSNAMTDDGKQMFKETGASSAMMGIQLNAPVWQLKVKLPEFKLPSNSSSLSNTRFLKYKGAPPIQKRMPKNKRSPVLPKKATSVRQAPPHHQGLISISSNRRDSTDSWSIVSKTEAPEPSTPIILAAPQWHFSVWTADNRGSPDIKMLRQRQDFIFSIAVQPGTEGNFEIEKAVITFDMNKDSSLMDGYSGAGASMVSNLRYNVRLVADGEFFRLPILPRSTREIRHRVPVFRTQEMSVFLPGVRVKCSTEEVIVKVKLNFTYIVGTSSTIEAQIKLVPQGKC